MVEIVLDYVNKSYFDGYIVVCDFNFIIVDGEFLILVGFFGCGKIMMLNMIVGFEDILLGELCIVGEWVNEKVLKDCDIVMVF